MRFPPPDEAWLKKTMTPHQPHPIDTTRETAEFEVLQTERPPREAQPPAQGRPSWDPDEGDFS
jgi:hypothetical protein